LLLNVLRQSEENQKDRQTIQHLTRNNIIPPINYVQVSSTTERNLWAADAVAYSMAQALLRSDLTLQEKSGIQLSIYDTQTLGLIDLKAPNKTTKTPTSTGTTTPKISGKTGAGQVSNHT